MFCIVLISFLLDVAVLFALRHYACEITEDAVQLYIEIAGQLSKKLEYVVYSVLCVMVDAYFDDEYEYERLITMMNENTSVDTAERFVSLEIMHDDLEVAHSDLEVAVNRIRELEAKVKELEERLDSK